MNSRTDFLLQLLQKLGAPLTQAVNAHVDPTDQSGQKHASVMASLLSESVKISVSLSQTMQLKPEDGDADAIRVALASIAGTLMADSYKQTGRLPSGQDTAGITKALEAVLVFADNFAPAAEHAQRLKTLEGVPPFFDPMETNLYSMHALLPVIAAIAEFSFGQQDTHLIQEVSEKLEARAKSLKDNLSISGDRMSELVLLQALAQIYAGVHKIETARLRAQGDTGQGAASIDAVWQSVDKQLAMLEVLLGAIGGTPAASSSAASGTIVPSAPTAEMPSTPPPLPPATGNPMSFFKKK